MGDLTAFDFTLSFLSVGRPKELEKTLALVDGFPNVQVILNGANMEDYAPLVDRLAGQVRFVVNRRNLGIAGSLEPEYSSCANTVRDPEQRRHAL